MTPDYLADSASCTTQLVRYVNLSHAIVEHFINTGNIDFSGDFSIRLDGQVNPVLKPFKILNMDMSNGVAVGAKNFCFFDFQQNIFPVYTDMSNVARVDFELFVGLISVMEIQCQNALVISAGRAAHCPLQLKQSSLDSQVAICSKSMS